MQVSSLEVEPLCQAHQKRSEGWLCEMRRATLLVARNSLSMTGAFSPDAMGSKLLTRAKRDFPQSPKKQDLGFNFKNHFRILIAASEKAFISLFFTKTPFFTTSGCDPKSKATTFLP